MPIRLALPTVSVAISLLLLGAMSGAMAAEAADTGAINWLCQQPSLSRVRITRIDAQVPDAPCSDSGPSSDPTTCRAVSAEAIVLDALPMLGAVRGLANSRTLFPGMPNRIRFRMASGDYQALPSPQFRWVGSQGLLGMRELPRESVGKPAGVSMGVYVPESAGAEQDLDVMCNSLRHWSGQRHPELPEELPGEHAARSEDMASLGRRLAGLFGSRPPDMQAIEQRFGARMLASGVSTPEASDALTLARLSAAWLDIRRESRKEANGQETVTLRVLITEPHSDARRAPWWDRDPSDKYHQWGDCVSAEMVMNQLGEDSASAKPDRMPFYSFSQSFSDYDVDLSISPRSPPNAVCVRYLQVTYRSR